MAKMPGTSDLKNSVIEYQVQYLPHFTPLDGACMSKRAATFDMQRISAAMTGRMYMSETTAEFDVYTVF